MSKTTILLSGNQVRKLILNNKGEPESALIKFGELYFPLGEEHIHRLSIHDTGFKLFNLEDEETHKNYTLNVEGLDLEETYRTVSQMFGVDFRSEHFKMFCYTEKENKDDAYARVKKCSNLREW